MTSHQEARHYFETTVFSYGMVISIVFYIALLVHDLFVRANDIIIWVDLANITVAVSLYFFHKRQFYASVLIFYAITLLGEALVWRVTAGWAGPEPYTMLCLIVFIVITSHGTTRWLTLAAYAATITILGYGTLPTDPMYHGVSIEAEFMVNTLMLILLTYYLKVKFIERRDSAENTSRQLNTLADTLQLQARQLGEQQQELHAMRENLEGLVQQKVREIEYKSEMLKKYAFVNAHHVRGPLARIIGIINVKELESRDGWQSGTVSAIKLDAKQMDTIIRKINDIVG